MIGTKAGSLFSISLSNFLKGFLMGGADIIPGVSGGTMALIVGIYERLIEAINQVFNFIFLVARFRFQESRLVFKDIEWSLIIPLAVGIGSAIFLLAHLINYFLTTYPTECKGLFFGLITASIAIPWSRASNRGIANIVVAALAFVLAFFSAGLAPHEIPDPSNLQIFGAAAIAICAMILPGVSGAFLLLVLGLYTPTTEAIKSLDAGYIAIFIAGAITGMGAFSRFLKWLLEKHHDTTMAALVGLMAGSLRALWPWQTENNLLLMPGQEDPIFIVVILAILGFLVVSALAWWEHSRVKI